MTKPARKAKKSAQRPAPKPAPADTDALTVAAMARAAADAAPPPSVQRKNTGVRHEPTPQTRALVELSMLNDMTHDQTARLVGIDANTLAKRYADELAFGKARMIARVSGNLYRIAAQQADLKAALTASIFLLKSKGGYNDRAAAESSATVEASGPIRFTLRLGERPAAD